MVAINSPVPGRGFQEPRQFARLTRGITNVYRNATDDDRADGLLWYPKAHDAARAIGRSARIHSNGPLREDAADIPDHVRGAGIISALSPKLKWDKNLVAAKEFARTGKTSLQYKANQRKAADIRAGVHPQEVLNPALTGGTSHKTWNFFQNIANPDDPHPVTIDRHAHDLAVGHRYGSETTDARGLGAAGRYNTFAEAYRRAGHVLGVPPPEVQATTWTAWRQRYGE